jgi:hypothetical protein
LFAAVFLASAPGRTPSILAGGLSEKPDVVKVYKLHVVDRALTHRTLKDLIDLLEGRSRTTVKKGSRPQTIRMEVTLPPDQSAYFLSKLSGLGELTPPSSDLGKEGGPGDEPPRRISIDIFDR